MEKELKEEVEPKKNGRPSLYTKELGDLICEQLAQGNSLRTVCKAEGMPDISTVFRWMRIYLGFCEQYTRAKQEASDALAEEIQDISDDGTNDWMLIHKGKDYVPVLNREHVERSKLRIETRKWIMAKMKPKKYGDKLDMTTNGKDLPTPIYNGKSVKQESDGQEQK